MARVDFYILDQPGLAVREQFACRIAEKAYNNGMRVFLLSADEEQTARLDRLLWTFRQGSFVPHASAAERDDEPVVIGTTLDLANPVLINLTDTMAAQWQDCARVAEVLDQRESSLQAGRRRYKEYQQHGHTPHTHRIEGHKR